MENPSLHPPSLSPLFPLPFFSDRRLFPRLLAGPVSLSWLTEPIPSGFSDFQKLDDFIVVSEGWTPFLWPLVEDYMMGMSLAILLLIFFSYCFTFLGFFKKIIPPLSLSFASPYRHDFFFLKINFCQKEETRPPCMYCLFSSPRNIFRRSNHISSQKRMNWHHPFRICLFFLFLAFFFHLY